MKILKSNRRVIDGHVMFAGVTKQGHLAASGSEGVIILPKNIFQSGVRVESFQQDRPVGLSSPAFYACASAFTGMLSKQPKASK